MTTVRVEAAVAGRRRAGVSDHPLQVELEAGPTSLGDLIAAIVRAEVNAFTARASDERLVRVLTDETLAQGLAAGEVRVGGRETKAGVDPEKAVATALEAQRDGLFQAIVNDEPVDEIDTIIDVSDGTRVMFLRLVPLVGG